MSDQQAPPKDQLSFYNAWGDKEIAFNHTVKEHVILSEEIKCVCGERARRTADDTFLCASDKCDFCSGLDGVDRAQQAWDFLPNTIVKFHKLPADCKYHDGTASDVGGEGTVQNLTLTSNGLYILVQIDADVVSSEYPGETFDEVWLPADECEIIERAPKGTERRHSTRPAPLHKIFHTSAGNYVIPPNSLKPFVVRYSTIYQAIGFSGKMLSSKPVDKKEWIRRYEKLSRPLGHDEEYDFFASYRWQSGRLNILISMFVGLNHLAAALCTFAITVFILFIASIVHSYADVKILPYWHPKSEDLVYKKEFQAAAGKDAMVFTSTWLFQPWFVLILMPICLVCCEQVLSKRKCFFDKVCISQTDVRLNQAALLSLPYILSRCKSLICFVDGDYFNRLWCMYEIAFFLRSNNEGDVRFVYSSQCKVFLVLFFMNSICITVVYVLWVLLSDDSGDLRLVGKMPVPLFLQNFIVWIGYSFLYLAGRMYYRDEEQLRKQSKEFDIRLAECAVMDDQEVLLNQIQQRFKNDDANSDPLDTFNRAVRKALSSQVVSRTFRILPYSMVLSATVGSWWLFTNNWVDSTLIDQLFYWAPWHHKNKFFSEQWFRLYIMNPYYIFVYIPFGFYTQSLIIKASYVIERRLKVPWWALLLPVVILMSILFCVKDFIFQNWIYYSVACVFRVPNQCPLYYPDYQKFRTFVTFVPFQWLFNSFGTGFMNGDQNEVMLSLTPVSQAFGFVFFIFAGVVVYVVHEPRIGRRYRIKLWNRIVGDEDEEGESLPIPKSELSFYNAWQKQNGGIRHSLKPIVGVSSSILCDCGLPAKRGEDDVYSCANDCCDFVSGADGVDCTKIGLHFLPSTVVKFDHLPSDCSYEDESEEDLGGEGTVQNITVTCDGLFVQVDIERDVVSPDYPNEVFTLVWFPAKDLEVIKRPKKEEPRRLSTGHALPHRLFQHIRGTGLPPNSLRPHIIRYSTWYHAIGFFGETLGNKDLSIDELKERFHRLSKPLANDMEYETFVSYRWGSGRFNLLVSMLVGLNYKFATVLAFCTTVCILFLASIIHTYGGVRVLPWWHANEFESKFIGAIIQFSSERNLVLTDTWVFSPWFILILTIPLLFCCKQLVSRDRIFYDKVCISQFDLNLNMAALLTLPYILSRCKHLVCFVDKGYFKRLWTMYEVAFFMKTNEDENKTNIQFVYASRCKVFLAVFFLQSATTALYYFLFCVAPVQDLATRGAFAAKMQLPIFLQNILYLIGWVLLYFAARAYYFDEQELRKQSKRFDVRLAQCMVESDQDILLSQIQQRFQCEDSIRNSLDVFNDHVRTALKTQVVSRSYRILPYTMIICASVATWMSYGDGFNGSTVLDQMFYNVPWSSENKFWGEQWYRVWIMNPYYILVSTPFHFYIQSLIIKLFHLIEVHWKVPWWILWVPVVMVLAIWESVQEWLFRRWMFYNVACVFGVSGVCPFDFADYEAWTENQFFAPFMMLLNTFGTAYNVQNHAVFAFILFLAAPMFVYFLHEPDCGKRIRVKIWNRITKRKLVKKSATLVVEGTILSDNSSNHTSSSIRQRRRSSEVAPLIPKNEVWLD